jgi:transcriptional regulator with XRE-family HTH domain
MEAEHGTPAPEPLGVGQSVGPSKEAIANLVRDCRQRKRELKLTLKAIALDVGVSAEMIRRYLKGSLPRRPEVLFTFLNKLDFNPVEALQAWGFDHETVEAVRQVEFKALLRLSLPSNSGILHDLKQWLIACEVALCAGEVARVFAITRQVLAILDDLPADIIEDGRSDALRFRASDLFLNALTRCDQDDPNVPSLLNNMIRSARILVTFTGAQDIDATLEIRCADLAAYRHQSLVCWNHARRAYELAVSKRVKAEALRCLLHALRVLNKRRELKQKVVEAEQLLAAMEEHGLEGTHEYLCLRQGVGQSLLHYYPARGVRYLADTVRTYDERVRRHQRMRDHHLEALLKLRYARSLLRFAPKQEWRQVIRLALEVMALSDGIYTPLYRAAEKIWQQARRIEGI